jgi:hypothetical protein
MNRAQDLHQLRIVVRRTLVARSEQPLIGGLCMGLTLRHLVVLLVVSHSESLFAPTSTRQDSASSVTLPAQSDRQRVFEGIPMGSDEVAMHRDGEHREKENHCGEPDL